MRKNRSSPAGETAVTRGYTLVEMLVVLTVLGLLITAVPVVISAGRSGVSARVEAQNLADELRAVRLLAINNYEATNLLIDLWRKTYVVQPRQRLHRFPETLELEFRDARGVLSDSPAEFRFFPDGSSTGGSLKISTRGEVHLVVAHALTGRISVDE